MYLFIFICYLIRVSDIFLFLGMVFCQFVGYICFDYLQSIIYIVIVSVVLCVNSFTVLLYVWFLVGICLRCCRTCGFVCEFVYGVVVRVVLLVNLRICCFVRGFYNKGFQIDVLMKFFRIYYFSVYLIFGLILFLVFCVSCLRLEYMFFILCFSF